MRDWAVLVVVEGPSAAGKTTWCGRWPTRWIVAEHGRVVAPSGLTIDEETRFWTELNRARWSESVRVERSEGIAICDTDPLKLHYEYSLARIGVGSWERFAAGVQQCRAAIVEHRLGIADVIMVELSDDMTLEGRRRGDRTRTRRNFDVHRRLAPAIGDWYSSLALVDPSRVIWGFPGEMPGPVVRSRYDVELFDRWMATLPGRA